MDYTLKPIGIIHTPYKEKTNVPIQGLMVLDAVGEIELLPKYIGGLKDLEDFSHIILIYVFDRSEGFDLQPIPFLDDVPKGVFSTRAPRRPNPIGFSIVELDSIHGNFIKIKGVDILDGTPLLDIKPYVSDVDSIKKTKNGWIGKLMSNQHFSDNRFGE